MSGLMRGEAAWYYPVVKPHGAQPIPGKASRALAPAEKRARRIVAAMRAAGIDTAFEVGIGRGFNRVSGPAVTVLTAIYEPPMWRLPDPPVLR